MNVDLTALFLLVVVAPVAARDLELDFSNFNRKGGNAHDFLKFNRKLEDGGGDDGGCVWPRQAPVKEWWQWSSFPLSPSGHDIDLHDILSPMCVIATTKIYGYGILGELVPEPDVKVLSEDPCSVELDFSTNDAAVQVFTTACNEMGGDILKLYMGESEGTCEYYDFLCMFLFGILQHK